ncbi:SLACS reverse transcriptase [Trypanosoma cruzi]|uniref:SLACS reverse transcriptase n=1 Tax=Trypanosoma cruzi TaxID=5693 RepID=A0A2V2UG55_TRYCR|nr:SLACS reverse transcriptase [Trypanosoma cruzi]
MEITAILTDMANGNVAPEVAHRLRATNLTVLRKPNKKFRPIGAECVWAKAISLMAVDAVMPALKTCFKNLQYGVGNNIELAIQKIRRDFHLKGSVAMLDGRNAYNAISRTAILSAVYGNTAWSPLWRVTRLLLGTEGLVGFYEKGQLVHSWKSTRECVKAWCWDRSYSPSAPSPPSANWKAAFPTPASRRTWTT